MKNSHEWTAGNFSDSILASDPCYLPSFLHHNPFKFSHLNKVSLMFGQIKGEGDMINSIINIKRVKELSKSPKTLSFVLGVERDLVKGLATIVLLNCQ